MKFKQTKSVAAFKSARLVYQVSSTRLSEAFILSEQHTVSLWGTQPEPRHVALGAPSRWDDRMFHLTAVLLSGTIEWAECLLYYQPSSLMTFGLRSDWKGRQLLASGCLRPLLYLSLVHILIFITWQCLSYWLQNVLAWCHT